MGETTTHNLTRRYWGHNIEFLTRRENGDWRACIFLAARIRPGDHVLAESQSHDALRYEVVGDVDRPMDPGDQHFATLRFVDREPLS